MKRVVIVVAGVMLLLLAGCEMDNSPQANATAVHASVTNAHASMTALYITPSPTSTPTPDANSLVSLLNNNINDELSDAIDAHYTVMDVSFTSTMEMFTTLYIFIRCECVNGSLCCTPERSTVMVIQALYKVREDIMTRMPNNIIEVQVICSEGNHQIGTVTVRWDHLIQYFRKDINGYQLGNRIGITPSP